MQGPRVLGGGSSRSRARRCRRGRASEPQRFHLCPSPVGQMTLLCGRRAAAAPVDPERHMCPPGVGLRGRRGVHCMVGPDWPCVLFTYSLIIVPSVFFLKDIAYGTSWIIFGIGLGLALLTLSSYTFIACSDPGIVYHEPLVETTAEEEEGKSARAEGKEDSAEPDPGDVEMGRSIGSFSDGTAAMVAHDSAKEDDGGTAKEQEGQQQQQQQQQGRQGGRGGSRAARVAVVTEDTPAHMLVPPGDFPRQQLVECRQCQMMRPPTAIHCYDCGVCVDGLDHHCPWTGKCIGKRTIHVFYIFLYACTTQLCFVLIVAFVVSVRTAIASGG